MCVGGGRLGSKIQSGVKFNPLSVDMQELCYTIKKEYGETTDDQPCTGQQTDRECLKN